MKTKKDIVKDWITRYSGREIKSFGKFILLTNFQKYVDEFARINNVNIDGLDKNMPSATHKEITIINFGMGSPNAALSLIHISRCRRRVRCRSRWSP